MAGLEPRRALHRLDRFFDLAQSCEAGSFFFFQLVNSVQSAFSIAVACLSQVVSLSA